MEHLFKFEISKNININYVSSIIYLTLGKLFDVCFEQFFSSEQNMAVRTIMAIVVNYK